jgi:hypothetical protein
VRHLLTLSDINARFRLNASFDRIALKRVKIDQVQGYRLVCDSINFYWNWWPQIELNRQVRLSSKSVCWQVEMTKVQVI